MQPAPLPRWPRPAEPAPHRRQSDAEVELPEQPSPIAERAASEMLRAVAQEFDCRLMHPATRARLRQRFAGVVDEAIAEARAEAEAQVWTAAKVEGRRKAPCVLAGAIVLAGVFVVLEGFTVWMWMQR